VSRVLGRRSGLCSKQAEVEVEEEQVWEAGGEVTCVTFREGLPVAPGADGQKPVMQISRRVDRGQADEGQHPPESGDEGAGGNVVSYCTHFHTVVLLRRGLGGDGDLFCSFALLLFCSFALPSFSFLRGSIHVCSFFSFCFLVSSTQFLAVI
jgi:hypothetical protein